MSNSPLVSHTNISPNRTSPRISKIDTITIHCVVGQMTVETIGKIFEQQSRQASSNYGIGLDGRIGLYVDENDRSWCSSNASNDHRAITIEVASDTFHPFAVTDKALQSLINLCADICRRNNIKELKWKGDKSLAGKVDQQNMTVHRWFANKACPGDYLYDLHSYIAANVNKLLNPPQNLYRVRKSLADVKSQIGAFSSFERAKAVAHENTGYSVYDQNGKLVYPVKQAFMPYTIKVTADILNVRLKPTVKSLIVNRITDKGVYTIVEESNGEGANKWGRLKSGSGWISLDFTKKL